MRKFTETQYFDKRWLFLIAVLIPIYFVFRSDHTTISLSQLLINFGIPLVVIIFIYTIKLQTTIDCKRIRIKFFPLANRNISWDDVNSAEVINYGFVGGWGVRKMTRYGTIYNTKGSMGLFITLKNGSKFVVGTQRPEELKRFLMNCVEIEQ